MVFVFFFLTYFTQDESLQFHPCCYKWHYFILFYGQVVSYCVYIPHLPDAVILSVDIWVDSMIGYCEQCCNEHAGACAFFKETLVCIYAQEWDCQVIWQFYVWFSKVPPYCFLFLKNLSGSGGWENFGKMRKQVNEALSGTGFLVIGF